MAGELPGVQNKSGSDHDLRLRDRGLTPIRCARLLQGDFDVYTGRQVEAHECVDSLVGGIDDIHEALMSTHFELVARRLVDVRRAQDVVATNPDRKSTRLNSSHVKI